MAMIGNILASSDLVKPKNNHILAALPPATLDRIAPHLELIYMPFGQVLCEPGEKLPYTYFPTASIICRTSSEKPPLSFSSNAFTALILL